MVEPVPRAIFSWCRLRNVRKSVDFPTKETTAAAMMQRALRNIRFFNIFKLFYASFRCDELK